MNRHDIGHPIVDGNKIRIITYFTATPSGNRLKLRHNFDLNEVTVIKHRMKEEFPNVFYVKAKEKSYQFEAEKADDWLKAINNAIEDCQNRLEQFQTRKSNQKSERVPSEMDFKDQLGFRAPIMIPNSDVSMCQVCTRFHNNSFCLGNKTEKAFSLKGCAKNDKCYRLCELKQRELNSLVLSDLSNDNWLGQTAFNCVTILSDI